MTREALACPAPEELRRHLLGWRPADEKEATRLDEHVATCKLCNERLGSPSDELIAELRVGIGSLEPPSETVRHLMERCKNLLARSTAPSAAFAQASSIAPMPSQVGPYRLLGVLGQGGMGVVYRAQHETHHRLAAIKMIASPLADEELLTRFRDEVEAIARLHHPNIIQLFEVGEFDSRPFVALELAEGGNLAEALAGLPQPPRAAAALIETLADAVAAAHQHGVVHRDLKPSNVLLTSSLASETSEADWRRAKIADFGLAKLLDSESTRTSTGRALGTPSYMAPEQARGDRDIGPACDVYALGAILYECLTGRPPFRGATPLETLAHVLHDPPPAPRMLVPRLPRDLEVITLKCLEKHPRHRYASALELRDDLRRHLSGRPIQARPAPLLRRVLMCARRRPALATLAAVSLLALGVVLGIWVKLTDDLRIQRDHALEQQIEAANQREQALQSLREARAAANDFFQLVHSDKELAEQGNHQLRYRLLARALLLQEKLTERYGEDPDLRLEMAHTHFNLGQLAFNLGKTDDALHHNQRSIELGEAQLRQSPDDVRVVRNQATRISERALYLSQLGRLGEAETASRRAIELLAQVARPSNDGQTWWHLGAIQDNFARLLTRRNRRDEAESIALAARDSLTEAIRLHFVNFPGDIYPGDYADRLARIHLHLSSLFALSGRWPAAEAEREAALPRIRDATRNSPRNPNYLHTQGLYLELRASQSRNSPSFEQTHSRYLEALEFRERLVRDYPRVTRLRAALAALHAEWAEFNAERQPELARASYRSALAAGVVLCQDSPKMWAYSRDLGRYALALDRLLDTAAADDAHLTQAITFAARWLSNDASPEVRSLLAQLYRARGERRAAAGHVADAEHDLAQASKLKE